MRTPASIAGHPIHPMLVSIPIGLWVFSFVCDLLFRFGTGASVWSTVAFYTLIGGVVGALVAAVPGFIDMLSLKQPIKKVALTHMAINLSIVALYLINIGLRINAPADALPMILSLVALSALLVSGWLGGHMVYVHRVGVTESSETLRP